MVATVGCSCDGDEAAVTNDTDTACSGSGGVVTDMGTSNTDVSLVGGGARDGAVVLSADRAASVDAPKRLNSGDADNAASGWRVAGVAFGDRV